MFLATKKLRSRVFLNLEPIARIVTQQCVNCVPRDSHTVPMVVNESAMANIPARIISPAERRANSKIIIPPAARSLITFTLNISHRVSLHVILRNSRTAVTALREYCSKYWLIPRAHRCEYLVVNNGAERAKCTYICVNPTLGDTAVIALWDDSSSHEAFCITYTER